MADSSSKTIQSESLRVATIRNASTENIAPSTSNTGPNGSPSDNPTCEASGSSASIRPLSTSVAFPRMMTVTRKGVLNFFHIENFENASEEESNFLRLLHFELMGNVKKLARQADGKADRVAQAVADALASCAD